MNTVAITTLMLSLLTTNVTEDFQTGNHSLVRDEREGTFIVGGYVASEGLPCGTAPQAFLMKLSDDGSELWSRLARPTLDKRYGDHGGRGLFAGSAVLDARRIVTSKIHKIAVDPATSQIFAIGEMLLSDNASDCESAAADALATFVVRLAPDGTAMSDVEVATMPVFADSPHHAQTLKSAEPEKPPLCAAEHNSSFVLEQVMPSSASYTILEGPGKLAAEDGKTLWVTTADSPHEASVDLLFKSTSSADNIESFYVRVITAGNSPLISTMKLKNRITNEYDPIQETKIYLSKSDYVVWIPDGHLYIHDGNIIQLRLIYQPFPGGPRGANIFGVDLDKVDIMTK